MKQVQTKYWRKDIWEAKSLIFLEISWEIDKQVDFYFG